MEEAITRAITSSYLHRLGDTRAVCRDAFTWKRLTHPNVVPFLGVTLEPAQFIYTWVSDEELKEYIIRHPDTDRLGLVGVPFYCVGSCSRPFQLTGIADGLNYLHSRNVVHGDLKGVRNCSKSTSYDHIDMWAAEYLCG